MSTTKESIPHVRIDKIKLYHGSGTTGIKIVLPAGEHTVGHGSYFTSSKHAAEMYALLRSSDGRTYFEEDAEGDVKKHIVVPNGPLFPVVYEVKVENLRLVDIRTHEDLKKVMVGFQKYLIELLDKDKEKMRWVYETNIKRAIVVIDILEGSNLKPAYKEEVELSLGKIESKSESIYPKDILEHLGADFSNYCKQLGYDGIVALEGGEGNGFVHDSYVIFDPEKVKIVQTVKIIKTEVHSKKVE